MKFRAKLAAGAEDAIALPSVAAHWRGTGNDGHWSRPGYGPFKCTAAVGLAALLAAAAGALAAVGWGAYGLALAAALGLLALGAAWPVAATRGAILAALLLVPDAPTGESWGLAVRWSHGLTLSNFVVPALALPLLGGAALAGRRWLPERCPGLARGYYWLLAWGLLTLLVPAARGELTPAAGATLLAHMAKLALFLGLGVVLAGAKGAGRRGLGKILLAGVAVNALVALGQAAGWLAVYSPLGAWQAQARSSGLFYDANMFAVMAAWALLWLLCELGDTAGARRWGGGLLAVTVAAALVAAGSRAGDLALAAGSIVLLWHGRWRPVAAALLLWAAVATAMPARGWQRLATAAAAVRADAASATVAAAAGDDAGISERLASMGEALRQIARHPLLGVGFGRALYLGVPAIGSEGTVRPAKAFSGAQNMPLTVWAETGPVGLLLFLAAVAGPLRRLQPWGAGLAMRAGFIGMLAACCTIEALWNARLLALVVMLTAGAGFGAGEPEASAARGALP